MTNISINSKPPDCSRKRLWQHMSSSALFANKLSGSLDIPWGSMMLLHRDGFLVTQGWHFPIPQQHHIAPAFASFGHTCKMFVQKCVPKNNSHSFSKHCSSLQHVWSYLIAALQHFWGDQATIAPVCAKLVHTGKQNSCKFVLQTWMCPNNICSIFLQVLFTPPSCLLTAKLTL